MTADVVNLHAPQRGRALLKFAIGKAVNNHNITNGQYAWPDIVDRFRKPIVTDETIEDYLAATPDVQSHIKDQGHFVPAHFKGGIRKKKVMSDRSATGLDVDHAPPDWQEDLLFHYGHLTFSAYTTHKHTPDKPRLRIVFPFTRSVNEIEHEALARKLAALWNIEYFDDTTYAFSRVMHFPSVSKNGEFVFFENEGKWVDPDEVLAGYTDYTDLSLWPRSSREENRWRESAEKVANPLEKPGLVGAFCRSYDIESAMEQFLPGVYAEGSTPGRFTYTGGSSSNGAVLYDDGLILFSHHESDPCFGKSVNAWDLVRLHLFGAKDKKVPPTTPGGQTPSFQAMTALARTDTGVQKEILSDRLALKDEFDGFDTVPFNPDDEARVVTSDKATIDSGGTEGWNLYYGENGTIQSTLHNLLQFLENDPRLSGCVRRNEFTDELLQFRSLPHMKARIAPGGIPWTDLAELKIKAYLERRYRVSFPTTLLHEGAVVTADRHSFNPPREWAASLVWDGVARLETFLIDYLGAEDTPYTRAIFLKWCCGAMARLLRPGCKFDYMLVAEGAEGILKSTLFKALAKDWFTDDMSFGYDSKEVVEKTRGAWIVEIPEMVARNSAEVEHNRAFISRQVERVRLSYARNAGVYPRSFALVGTTNEGTYLRSLTGNRRYWMFSGDGRSIDLAKIVPIIDQLWAEAKEREMFGEPLYLSDDVLALARIEQDKRIEVDDWCGMIESWLDKELSATYWDEEQGSRSDVDSLDDTRQRDRTCALEVWVECLGEPAGRFSRRDASRIYSVMKKMKGWTEHTGIRFGTRYGRTRGFMRSV